jgi:alpha-beta hydrolase superfamily lysophospholipase
MSALPPHGGQPVLQTGLSVEMATAAAILVPGRGASAEDILALTRELNQPGFAYLAPQAAGNTRYPYSFLAPLEQNEPGLSSGLSGTAVFLGAGDPDPHVPWSRVEETATVFDRMGAAVDLRRYPGMGHSISREQIATVRRLMESLLKDD